MFKLLTPKAEKRHTRLREHATINCKTQTKQLKTQPVGLLKTAAVHSLCYQNKLPLVKFKPMQHTADCGGR